MAIKGDYETRPISDDVWGFMKQLRRDHFWKTWKAQEEGGIVITGIAFGYQPLLAGFGTVATPSMGTGFTRLARLGTAPEGLRQYVDITTAKGLTPMCGAIAAHIGQVWEGISFKNPKTKEEITPDFMYCAAGCHAIQKGSQICGEILGIPMMYIDQPHTKNVDNYIDYVAAQLMDSIEWIEKRTGKQFNDEAFIKSVGFNIKTSAFWAKIADLTKNVPSPMTARQAASLHTPIVTMAYSKDTMEYLEALYDEMQQRVKDGISGAPFERKRLSHEGGVHPLYRPDVLRWPEEYGASFVLGWGVWGGVYNEKGEYVSRQNLEDRGIELKNREDAIRAMIDPFGFMRMGINGRRNRREQRLRMLKDWKIEGVMLHLARRCAFATAQIFDIKRELEDAGIITGTYEASEGDPNEFEEIRIREDFDRFFDSLGLSRFEKK